MKYQLTITALLALVVGCSSHPKSSTSVSDSLTGSTQIESAPFNVDSAYSYLKQQVNFGKRVPNSDAHAQCKSWLVEKLKSWGYNVQIQSFPGKDYFGKSTTGYNIIASLNPESKDRQLFMAHWDTRPVADEDGNSDVRQQPIDGADDGASGVGVLLELARQFRQSTPSFGVDFVFFDLEDGGSSGDEDSWCLGSQYWSKHPHTANYTARGGVLLDMVGARDARFHWEGNSQSHAAPLMMDLWDTARALGHTAYFKSSDGGAMIDDHVPVIQNLGIPCVDIINYSTEEERMGFGSHWHTQQDNLKIIDKATLQAVGQTLITYFKKQ